MTGRRISGATAVYGLLGDPVAHSLSPRICNHAFAALDIDAVYVALPCDARRPDVVLAGCEALGLAGLNVTYPLKAAVVPYLRHCSPAARAIGAVNVLAPAAGGGFAGENTDAPGVALALQTWLGRSLPAGVVAVLGAGAAARAAAAGALALGVERVTFLVRDRDRAEDAVGGLREAHGPSRLEVAALDGASGRAALAAAELVVQATPVGLGDPEAPPLLVPDDAPRAAGFELNYGCAPTAFVRAWREAGRPCLDGRDLLAAQAHRALEIWLGRAPDVRELRALLDTVADERPDEESAP